MKKVARFYQADLVGICELDKRWVFGRQMMKDIVFENVDQPYETDEKRVIPEKCKYVVVMGVESERENFKCYTPEGRTSELVEASVGLGYSRQAIAHTFVAEFLRNLGYLAIPHANDTSFTGINMAAAGIANIGRMGIATCPEYGPQIRGSKVFTDLPMEPDKIIDLGLNEFCAVCKKCNRYCPGGSIPDGPRTWESQTAHSYNNPGVFKWYVCHSECRKQWNDSGTACAMCITSCPWGKGPGWFHDVARWSSANIPALDSFWVWLDDAMGYGARIDAKEYWENHPVTWHHGTRANFQRMRPNHEP